MEVPPKPANDNEPQERTMNRVAITLSMKLGGMGVVLGTIARKGFSSPEGQKILQKLMEGFYNAL